MAEKLPSTGKYMDEQDKERVVVEVTHRVMDAYGRDPRKVEQALFDTLYDEWLRLRTEKDKDEVKRLSGYYKKMQSEAARADGEHQRELLQELIGHYTTEVSGHFDKRVYKVATSLLPTLITGLLNTMSPLKLIQGLPRGFETLGDDREQDPGSPHLQQGARTRQHRRGSTGRGAPQASERKQNTRGDPGCIHRADGHRARQEPCDRGHRLELTEKEAVGGRGIRTSGTRRHNGFQVPLNDSCPRKLGLSCTHGSRFHIRRCTGHDMHT